MRDFGEFCVKLLFLFFLGLEVGVAMDFVFPIVLIYSMMVTVAMGVLASLRFDTMEQLV